MTKVVCIFVAVFGFATLYAVLSSHLTIAIADVTESIAGHITGTIEETPESVEDGE